MGLQSRQPVFLEGGGLLQNLLHRHRRHIAVMEAARAGSEIPDSRAEPQVEREIMEMAKKLGGASSLALCPYIN